MLPNRVRFTPRGSVSTAARTPGRASSTSRLGTGPFGDTASQALPSASRSSSVPTGEAHLPTGVRGSGPADAAAGSAALVVAWSPDHATTAAAVNSRAAQRGPPQKLQR